MSEFPDYVLKKIQEAQINKFRTLDLSRNNLLKIPELITEIPSLNVLDLSRNQIVSLPKSITKLYNLKEIYLNDNQIEFLPESISQLPNLTIIDLSNNQLKKLPESISQIPNLTGLYLSNNQLKIIPESIAKLSNLSKLYLSYNRLEIFPEFISKLSALTWINLVGNKIKILPESMIKLSNLSRLYLSYNKLQEFPEFIIRLPNLTLLDLEKNQIKNLPESITNIPDYIGINLDGNPLVTPPIEIFNLGKEELSNYYRQLNEKGKDYVYEAKLLIVGEAGAGKTSLAKKIQNSQYKLQETEETTEGIDVIKWSFSLANTREFKVNIWDFGGQEIYHATHQFFLTKRSLYALVVDTRKEDTDFHYWLNVVELLSDNSPLLIIQNEKQERKRDINKRALRGRFSNLKETISTNLATNRGLNRIVDKVKHYIQDLDHVGQALPKTWVLVRQALEKDERNYISLNEYFEICQKNGFVEEKDKLQLSGYLHDLGVCLHFQDKEESLLYKTVIIKPEWGTSAVYRVLDNKQVINNQGCFSRDDLKEIWQEKQYSSMRGELLELMKKFKLCYEIPKRPNNFIAPQLLSSNQPEYKWNNSNNLILRYSYPEFMPKGIISRFIVIMHQYIEQQTYVWRTGVILNYNPSGLKNDIFSQRKDIDLRSEEYHEQTSQYNKKKVINKAEIIEDYGKREITIRVVGNDKQRLMTVIAYELDEINNSYTRLKYQKLIPCNCFQCKNQQEPYFHSYQVLLNAKEKRQLKVQCLKSFQMINILSLIDDIFINYNSEVSHSTRNAFQSTTVIEHQHNYLDKVESFIGSDQKIEKKGDHITNIKKGNYIEHISSDHIDNSRSQDIFNSNITNTGAGAFNLGDNYSQVANNLNPGGVTQLK